ncbi:beta strand repeat-containing protein, partial [Sphingomonas parva]|uniref:beta strand repeat-containing protein n=1 Tax=Sphingomonas parva TaxID=2555898 RepID=UPI0014314A0A
GATGVTVQGETDVSVGGATSSGGLVTVQSTLGGVTAGPLAGATGVTVLGQTDVRLASATSSTGPVAVTATTGDVSGLALGSPATDGRLLVNFGRTDLTASGASQTIIVSAGGNAQLGTLTAGTGASLLAADQISVSADAVDMLDGSAANGDIRVLATSGTLRTRDVSVLGTGRVLRLGASGSIVTGTLRSNGGDMLLSASGDVTVGGASTALGGTPATGTIAILAGNSASTGAVTAGTLSAGEDIAISAGAAVSLTSLTAGDDIDVDTNGVVTFNAAVSTGTGADTRAVTFARASAGSTSAIGFAGPAGQAGHNINIRAASLGSVLPITGDVDDGLVLGTLDTNTAFLTADAGDIRADLVDASGNVAITALAGSLSGRIPGFDDGTGGATISAPGTVRLDVTGSATLGSVNAGTLTNESLATPDSIRIRNVTAGTLTLTSVSRLQIGTGNVTG